MTEDSALLAAVLAHPDEDTPRLVLADWFDEHDEPMLAQALREEPQLVPFLAALTRWDRAPARQTSVYQDGEVRPAWRTLPAAQLLVRYRHLFPVPPDAPVHFDPDAKPPRQVDDPIDSSSFLWAWQYARQRQIRQGREQAARDADRWADSLPRFDPCPPITAEFEWQSCVLHELAIRGRDVSTIPGAVAHAAEMDNRRHPLAWLPRHLVRVESELQHCLPRFFPGGYGGGGLRTPPEPLRGPAEVPVDAPAVTGTVEPPSDSPALDAVRGWAEESNGEFEARVFSLDRPVEPDSVGRGWFARLPADSVVGVEAPPARLSRCSAPDALAHLFMAAQSGGAYGRQEWGAYGRLHAWQSFGWLAGCEGAADAHWIASEAEKCLWLTFGGTDWFLAIVDMGLICIRPDRRSVALLAATDTD